jgi:hypothetical protein
VTPMLLLLLLLLLQQAVTLGGIRLRQRPHNC